MLLNEIVITKVRDHELAPEQLAKADYGKIAIKMLKKDQFEKLGQGNQGIVMSDKHDPHVVVKVGKSFDYGRLNKDAHFKFISAIINKAGGNPFLPRVYEIKVYRNADEKSKVLEMFIAKMEKLIPLDKLSKAEVQVMAKKLMVGADSGFVEEFSGYDIIDAVSEAVGMDQPEKFIKDKKLIQAIHIIKQILATTPGGENDIDFHNVMFRRGPTGPQLVLNDPVAGGK